MAVGASLPTRARSSNSLTALISVPMEMLVTRSRIISTITGTLNSSSISWARRSAGRRTGPAAADTGGNPAAPARPGPRPPPRSSRRNPQTATRLDRAAWLVARHSLLWAQLPDATVGLFGDRVHVTSRAVPPPVPGDAPPPLDARIRAALATEKLELHSLRPIEPSLEDVFLDLVERTSA